MYASRRADRNAYSRSLLPWNRCGRTMNDRHSSFFSIAFASWMSPGLLSSTKKISGSGTFSTCAT